MNVQMKLIDWMAPYAGMTTEQRISNDIISGNGN
jgi:hypothetical protein